MKEETFPVSKESAALFWSSQWQNKLKEFQVTNHIKCKVISSGNGINACIIAINGVVEVTEKVKIFLKRSQKLRPRLFEQIN